MRQEFRRRVIERSRERKFHDSMTDYIVNDIFKYSHERYMNAYNFFTSKKIEESIIGNFVVYYLSPDIKERLQRQNVFLIPDKSISDVYSYLIAYLGYNREAFMDILNDKKDIIKEFGLLPPHLYMLASGKEIPSKTESVEKVIKTVDGRLVISPLEVGGGIEKENGIYSSSKTMLGKEDLPYILGFVLAEVNKRGRILNRKPVMITLTSYETRLFGKTLIRLVPEFENIKLAITLPSKEDANSYYDVLSSNETFSLFFSTITPNEADYVAYAVYEAITWDVTRKKMPGGLRELVDFLDKRGYLKKTIKYITREVGYNPILAIRATIVFLARMYGNMNRRARKLEKELEKLREQGNNALANEIERVLAGLVIKNRNIAIASVIGTKKRLDRVVPTEKETYIDQLKEFISGLSTDRLERLYLTLNKKVIYEDAVNVLLNIGAVVVKDDSFVKTRIGILLNKLVEKELKRRRMQSQSRREQLNNTRLQEVLQHLGLEYLGEVESGK